MQQPRISVVMATYNYGHYITHALESIRAQTYRDFEVLIVDDGSSDDTAERVRPFLDDPRFRYEVIDHAGQPAAKNHGILGTNGEFVAFLDADDIWMPNKLERQLSLFDSNPELGVTYTRRIIIDPDGKEGEVVRNTFYRGQVLAEMFRVNFVCFSSSMVRREVFHQVGLFNGDIPLAIDYDLWLRAASEYSFDYVEEPMVKYRRGHANLSQRGEERLYIALRIMRRFLATRPEPAVLPRDVIRMSFAETYSNLAYMKRDRSTIGAFGAYLRALTYRPNHWPAWRGLAIAAMPSPVRDRLRLILSGTAENAK